MNLDVPTLMAAGVIATASAGVMLALAWNQLRDQPALAWWSAAGFTMSVALVILIIGLTVPIGPVVSLGSAVSVVSGALVWAGLRRFDGRKAPIALIVAGPLATLAVGPLAALAGADPMPVGALVSFASWIAYLLATIFGLWRGRAEKLWARHPLTALMAIHAAIIAGGVVSILDGTLVAGAIPPAFSWFGLIHFGTILHWMGAAILMFALCKERREIAYRSAASIDSLTGVANRGAFMAQAEQRLERCRHDAMPASLIVFDLDRFKSVNDTFGHQTGDRVLQLFARIAQAAVRPNDFFGRHGGEEFAMILPGSAIETARAVAERIRAGFAEASAGTIEPSLRATVSAGVAAMPPDASVDDLIAAADGALYEAKNSGRNRVCLARHGAPLEPATNVVRVA